LVAEGIEEEAEEALLIENACDMAQGYKYSKPLPEDKLVEWVSGQ
jgi:EAL domain-containing protein (putative c-di-GMP-specific phosphodiesterase class I)